MLLYILEENIFFFINHCGVTTCGQTDQEPVKLSKVSKVSKYIPVSCSQPETPHDISSKI